MIFAVPTFSSKFCYILRKENKSNCRRSGVNGEKLGSFKVLKRSIGVKIAHNRQNSRKNAKKKVPPTIFSTSKNVTNVAKKAFFAFFGAKM